MITSGLALNPILPHQYSTDKKAYTFSPPITKTQRKLESMASPRAKNLEHGCAEDLSGHLAKLFTSRELADVVVTQDGCPSHQIGQLEEDSS